MSTTEEKVLLLEQELKHQSSPLYVSQYYLGVWIATFIAFFLFMKIFKPSFVTEDNKLVNAKMYKVLFLFSIISFTGIYVYYHVQRKKRLNLKLILHFV